MPIEQAQAVRTAREAELRTAIGRTLTGWPEAFTLEIGCGHGHFLAAYAVAHPAEHCLGIDIILDRLDRATRKVERAGSRNAAFLRAEARMFLEVLPEHHRLRRIFVLFPDPWPKRRHHKNRLMSSSFLHLLARRATPETRLCFRTDHEPYFAEVVATLARHPDWQLRDEPWPFEQVTVFQSRAPAYQSCIAAPRGAA